MTRTSAKHVIFAAACALATGSMWYHAVSSNQFNATREADAVCTEVQVESAAEVVRNLLLASGFSGM